MALTRSFAVLLLAVLALVPWPSVVDAADQGEVRARLADPGAAGARSSPRRRPAPSPPSGLDVTIDRGTGSQKTIEQVATGTYDMGYGDINSMIEYNVKNPADTADRRGAWS